MMMMFSTVVCVLVATAIPLTQSAVVFSNEVSPATTYMGVARTPFVDALRRRCPLCDSSVYPYCSEKLFHDSCCCHNPHNPLCLDRLPYECQYADCSFLHANSCEEHKLISACCCTNLYVHFFPKSSKQANSVTRKLSGQKQQHHQHQNSIMMDEKTLFVENIKARMLENAMKYRDDSLQSSINSSLRLAREHAGEDLDGKKGITSLIYEMNEFYVEMADRLRVLTAEFGRDDDERAQIVDEDAESVFSEELVDSLQKYGDPDQIRNQIDVIRKLEEEVAQSFKQLEVILSALLLLIPLTLGIVQLARNSRTMESFSITDEEKIKLESLLSDMEIIEMGVETNARDAFAMAAIDSNRLEALEIELNSLNVDNDCVSCFEAIEENEREGKYWKTEQRLRRIDEELKSFQEEREKQQQIVQDEEEAIEDEGQQKQEIANDKQINN